MRVKIIKTGINGEGIGYIDKKPVFIEGALPEEEVEIKIVDKQPRFYRAKINRIVSKSKERVKAPCSYINKCGGCTMMHINYEAQLKYKYEILKQSLIKYAQIDPRKISKLHKNPNPFIYRNALKLPFAMDHDKLVCGLYTTGSNFFNRIDHCMVHEEGLEATKKEIIKILNRYHFTAYDRKTKKGLRTLVLRGFDHQYQCTLVSGNDLISKECIEDIMNIDGMKSLWQSIHTSKKSVDTFGKTMNLLAGTKLLEFNFDKLRLRLSPKAFFQLNTKQAEYMYRTVAEMVGDENKLIIEAYSGIGAISLYLKDKAKEIIGIESVGDAVSNANRNAELNRIENVRFLCGDAGEKLRDIAKKKEIDVLVVDPPRSGLDENMMECIMRGKIKQIIYISCNPATLGKNLALLQKKYIVEKVQPLDIFSQSAHIESIVKLSRKK